MILQGTETIYFIWYSKTFGEVISKISKASEILTYLLHQIELKICFLTE